MSEVWRRGSVIASWLLDLTAMVIFGALGISEPVVGGWAQSRSGGTKAMLRARCLYRTRHQLNCI